MKIPEKFVKLAANGAIGAAGGIMLAWLGLVWFLRPVPGSGIDGTSHFAVATAAFVPMAVLAAAHLWFGVQLRRGPDSIKG